jgi:hypothetical protein
MTEILVEVRPVLGEPGDLAPKVFQPQLLKDRIDELGESLAEIAGGLRQQLDQVPPPAVTRCARGNGRGGWSNHFPEYRLVLGFKYP